MRPTLNPNPVSLKTLTGERSTNPTIIIITTTIRIDAGSRFMVPADREIPDYFVHGSSAGYQLTNSSLPLKSGMIKTQGKQNHTGILKS